MTICLFLKYIWTEFFQNICELEIKIKANFHCCQKIFVRITKIIIGYRIHSIFIFLLLSYLLGTQVFFLVKIEHRIILHSSISRKKYFDVVIAIYTGIVFIFQVFLDVVFAILRPKSGQDFSIHVQIRYLDLHVKHHHEILCV